jgi:hypothetical protein
MYSHYREVRVKVTSNIEKELFKLLTKENDVDKKKKHPAKWYRDQVSKSLKLAETDNPSLRSYENFIHDLKKNIKVPNDLDNQWSIGSSIRYDIPADIIPKIIELEVIFGHRVTEEDPRVSLSIRSVRWMAKLYHSIINLVTSLFPEIVRETTNNIPKYFIYEISQIYAYEEYINEHTEKQDFNTCDLDRLFFLSAEFWEFNTGEYEKYLRHCKEEEIEPVAGYERELFFLYKIRLVGNKIVDDFNKGVTYERLHNFPR